MFSQPHTDRLAGKRAGNVLTGPGNLGNQVLSLSQRSQGDGLSAPFRPFSQVAVQGSQQQPFAMPPPIGTLSRPGSAPQAGIHHQNPEQNQNHFTRVQHAQTHGFTSISGASGLPQGQQRFASAGSSRTLLQHSAARPATAPTQNTIQTSRPSFVPLTRRAAPGSTTGNNTDGPAGPAYPALRLGSTTAAAGATRFSATAATSLAASAAGPSGIHHGPISMSQKSLDYDMCYGSLGTYEGSAGAAGGPLPPPLTRPGSAPPAQAPGHLHALTHALTTDNTLQYGRASDEGLRLKSANRVSGAQQWHHQQQQQQPVHQHFEQPQTQTLATPGPLTQPHDFLPASQFAAAALLVPFSQQDDDSFVPPGYNKGAGGISHEVQRRKQAAAAAAAAAAASRQELQDEEQHALPLPLTIPESRGSAPGGPSLPSQALPSGHYGTAGDSATAPPCPQHQSYISPRPQSQVYNTYHTQRPSVQSENNADTHTLVSSADPQAQVHQAGGTHDAARFRTPIQQPPQPHEGRRAAERTHLGQSGAHTSAEVQQHERHQHVQREDDGMGSPATTPPATRNTELVVGGNRPKVNQEAAATAAAAAAAAAHEEALSRLSGLDGRCSGLSNTLSQIAERTAKVEEAVAACQKMSQCLPDVTALLHQHGTLLQQLLAAQEAAAAEAAAANTLEQRRIELLAQGLEQRRSRGVDRQAQTSPMLALPPPRGYRDALPTGSHMGRDPGGGQHRPQPCGGGSRGGRGAPRRQYMAAAATTTTTTTATVIEEEEEVEVAAAGGMADAEGAHMDGDRSGGVDDGGGNYSTPASRGPGSSRRLRSLRVQHTHTHTRVVEQRLFSEEYYEQNEPQDNNTDPEPPRNQRGGQQRPLALEERSTGPTTVQTLPQSAANVNASLAPPPRRQAQARHPSHHRQPPPEPEPVTMPPPSRHPTPQEQPHQSSHQPQKRQKRHEPPLEPPPPPQRPQDSEVVVRRGLAGAKQAAAGDADGFDTWPDGGTLDAPQTGARAVPGGVTDVVAPTPAKAAAASGRGGGRKRSAAATGATAAVVVAVTAAPPSAPATCLTEVPAEYGTVLPIALRRERRGQKAPVPGLEAAQAQGAAAAAVTAAPAPRRSVRQRGKAAIAATQAQAGAAEPVPPPEPEPPSPHRTQQQQAPGAVTTSQAAAPVPVQGRQRQTAKAKAAEQTATQREMPPPPPVIAPTRQQGDMHLMPLTSPVRHQIDQVRGKTRGVGGLQQVAAAGGKGLDDDPAWLQAVSARGPSVVKAFTRGVGKDGDCRKPADRDNASARQYESNRHTATATAAGAVTMTAERRNRDGVVGAAAAAAELLQRTELPLTAIAVTRTTAVRQPVPAGRPTPAAAAPTMTRKAPAGRVQPAQGTAMRIGATPAATPGAGLGAVSTVAGQLDSGTTHTSSDEQEDEDVEMVPPSRGQVLRSGATGRGAAGGGAAGGGSGAGGGPNEDEFAKAVEARMTRHRQKRLRLMFGATPAEKYF